MLILPSDFISTITNTFGEDGKQFLANLPALIEEASARWGLTNIQPIPNLSYNFVAYADLTSPPAPLLKGEGSIVLKLGIPRDELTSEIVALRLLNGEGACKLIDADEEKGFLLLERLQPGEMLSTLEDDEEATRIAAEVMKRVWRPLNHVTLSPEGAKGLYANLQDYFDNDIKPFVDSLDYKEQPLVVTTATAKYYYDNEQETLIEKSKGKKKALGCGKIVVKAAYKSANKKQGERFEVTVELAPDTEKDYEIIPFRMDAAQNQAEIAAFMAKYVSKPFEYLENVIGAEINFNRVFYKPENLRSPSAVLEELEMIESELKALEQSLGL